MLLKSVVLQFALMVADAAGLNRLFRRLNKGKTRLLMYHGVSAERSSTPYWTLLALDKFRWQMQYLKRHYDVVPATHLLDSGGEDSLSKYYPVIITFDDGLANTYTEAWPVLRELRLCAICFVLPSLSEAGEIVWTDRLYSCFMTAPETELPLGEFGLEDLRVGGSDEERARKHRELAGQLKSWPHEKRERLLAHLFDVLGHDAEAASGPFRLMSKEQIVELGRSEEFQIGAHTCRHVILSTLSPEEQDKEIGLSLEKTNEWCDHSVPIFCYPNGQPRDFSETTIDLLRRRGVKAALSTNGGFHDDSDDMYRIKRVPIGSDITRAEFKARLSGLYQFLTAAAGHGYS